MITTGNYIFNIIFNTTGLSLENKHVFDIPPFYFQMNELVYGEAQAYITSTQMQCSATDYYTPSIDVSGYVSEYCYTTKSTAYGTTPISIYANSESYAAGYAVLSAIVYIYTNSSGTCAATEV